MALAPVWLLGSGIWGLAFGVWLLGCHPAPHKHLPAALGGAWGAELGLRPGWGPGDPRQRCHGGHGGHQLLRRLSAGTGGTSRLGEHPEYPEYSCPESGAAGAGGIPVRARSAVPTRCRPRWDEQPPVWPGRRRFPAPTLAPGQALPNRRLAPRSSHSHLGRYKTPARRSPRTPGPARAAAAPERPRETPKEPERAPRDPERAPSSRMGQCNCRKKRKDCQELTDVERAIETVISQFHCYAVKGQKEYLTPNEMQELVVQKLPHLGKCVGPLEEKIECMGDPNEAKLEFGEYWDMMGDAAKGCRRK